jgi:hypothetical protein
VQYWWNRWLHPKSHLKEILDQNAKFVVKEIIDTKSHIKEVIDTKVHFKEIIDTGGVKRIKDKEKDLVENKVAVDVVDPFQQQGDPALIKNLIEAVGKLQAQAGVKRSPFIKPFTRPMVGEQITKRSKKDEK